MNKQELIKEYENIVKDDSLELRGCYNMADRNFMRKIYKSVLEDLKQLDEPQKLEIPQFVADWIKYCKNTNVTLVRALLVEEIDLYNYANQKDSKKLKEFLRVKGNQELFARAWLDGYQIEEKQYKVRAKGVYYNSGLIFDKTNKKWSFSSIYETDHQRASHTRKELEEAGFGEVFNSPLFEVEEVTE